MNAGMTQVRHFFFRWGKNYFQPHIFQRGFASTNRLQLFLIPHAQKLGH